MSERRGNAVAIVPCNDIDAAERWWEQLGFRRSSDVQPEDYRMLSDGRGAEIHLQTAPEGWVVPGRNPLGIYLYTSRVDEMARRLPDAIVGPTKAPEHKPWGMYEVALNGPDDLLVRIGWPSDRVRGRGAAG